MVKLAENIKNVPQSPTLWANDLVHEKRNNNEIVYHMGFGESPFPAPARLQKALADETYRTEYQKVGGMVELTEAVREYYRDIHGSDYVDQCDVVVAPGSKLILYALQMAIEGDLLMPVPSWVSYGPQAEMLQTDVVKVPTILDDEGYKIAPDTLRETIRLARAKGQNPSKIIINAPNNPTGLTIPTDNLREIAQVCEEEDIFIISDEIYGIVSFDGEYRSCAPMKPHITAVTTGLSKHLSLGGWRLGVGFIPKAAEGLAAAMRNIASETWSCTPSPIQKACVEAYKRHQDIEDHIKACTEIHKLMNQTIAAGLQKHGIIAPMVQGAFYNYPNFEPFRDGLAVNGITTSQKIHEILLTEFNLATLPGHAFGAEKDVLTLRLSGCDYDGDGALQAYQNGETLDMNFVAKHAPNILKSIDIFGSFVAKYGKEKSSHYRAA